MHIAFHLYSLFIKMDMWWGFNWLWALSRVWGGGP